MPEILEVFEVGFAHAAEEQAFEAGLALAIVHTHLGQQPEGFATASCATVANF
jgi:hypothetical protein